MPRSTSPYYEVIYEGIDITSDISDDVISIVYTDAVEEEADEIQITLDDMSGKWKSGWRTRNGDSMSLRMGYSEESLMDCGSFSIDEVVYKGQPDIVEIKALSINVDSELKTQKSVAYEGQTLIQIAQAVADNSSMELEYLWGNAVSTQAATDFRNKVMNTVLARVTQERETDLMFLNRVGAKFGVSFSVKNGTHIYYLVNYDMQVRNSSYSIDYIESIDEQDEGFDPTPVLSSYSLKDSGDPVVGGVDVVYHNDDQNRIYTYGQPTTYFIKSYGMNQVEFLSDKLKINEFRKYTVYEDVDNQQQAEIVADAAWMKWASKKVTGKLVMEGMPNVIAGTSINVNGLGSLSGKYFIQKSRHTISRSKGYQTKVDVNLVVVGG